MRVAAELHMLLIRLNLLQKGHNRKSHGFKEKP